MKGTARRTKLELAEDLESRAASLSFSSDASDPVGVDISGAALSRDTDLLLEALLEVLRLPGLSRTTSSTRRRSGMVGAIRQQQDQTSARAFEEAMRRVYPPDHPLHRLTGEERIARVEALEREDLAAFYEERYGAASLRLVVVGDVEARAHPRRARAGPGGLEARARAPRFPPWRCPPPARAARPWRCPTRPAPTSSSRCPRDLKRTDADFLACSLANSALGQSSLTSRLGVRVRDTEGLTYGIHSSFSRDARRGAVRSSA